jgi:Mechanosensitive ion channel
VAVARAVARASLWRAAPAIDEGSARAQTEALVRLAVPCEGDQGDLQEFQSDPERTLVDPSSRAFDRGASLFFDWLDTTFARGPGQLIGGLWALAPTRTPPAASRWSGAPTSFDVIRESLKAVLSADSTLDDLFVRFAVRRAQLTPAARLAWHVPWPLKPRRLASAKPVFPTGASYVLVDRAGAETDAKLRMEAQWEDYGRMRWVVVKLDAAGQARAVVPVKSLDRGTRASLTVESLAAVDRILIVGVNVGSTEHPFDPNQGEWEPHGWLLTLAAETAATPVHVLPMARAVVRRLLWVLAILAGTVFALLASADAPLPSFDVRLHEKAVFSLRVDRAEQTPRDRARAATRALESALDDPEQALTRIEEASPSSAVIFIGKTPVVTLSDDDARAAGGDVTLHVYAAGVASKIDSTLRAERKRSAIATRVLSFSLLVSSALLTVLLFRRVGDLSVRARLWVRRNPDRIPALKLGRIEVVRPAAVRGALSIALALGHRIAQFAICYSWLIFALSRFEATRDYTDRLASFVLTPLSALIGRAGSALPLFVVAVVAAVALGVAVRFVELFFAGVTRGETHLTWLPRELAAPTSVLVRAGIVLVCIVLAAPLLTGTDDGALSRAGVVALVAIGLACTPVLACAAAGVPMVFGRKVKPGDFVEAGGRAGIVREVTLLELVLEDSVGCEVHIPQLLALWHPTRVLGGAPMTVLDIAVDPLEEPAKVLQALAGATGAACDRARIDLVSLDADAARWRVSGVAKRDKGTNALAEALVKAIKDRGIALGRRSK